MILVLSQKPVPDLPDGFVLMSGLAADPTLPQPEPPAPAPADPDSSENRASLGSRFGRRLRSPQTEGPAPAKDPFTGQPAETKRLARRYLDVDSPKGKDLRVRRVLDLIQDQPGPVIVAADRESAVVAKLVTIERPDVLAIRDVSVARNLLTRMDELGLPHTVAHARTLLDPEIRPIPRSTIPPRTRPMVVQLVGNAVSGDSRVQKVAATLGRLGYESVLIGVQGSHGGAVDQHFFLGNAQVDIHAAPLDALYADREEPPRAADSTDAPRSAIQLRAAEARAIAESRRRDVRAWRRRRAGDPAGAAELRRENRAAAIRVAADGQRFRANRDAFRSLQMPDQAQVWQPPEGFGGDTSYARVLDLEDELVPAVLRYRPDVIHAHDSDTLSAGALAAARLRQEGHDVRLVYDAHEMTEAVARSHPTQRFALSALEREFIGMADAVITVSDVLAAHLQAEHGLDVRPSVVLNAPVRQVPPTLRDIRADIGLDADVPLIVYAGGCAPQRGTTDVVSALADLPGTHLALVSPMGRGTAEVLRHARAMGVAHRVTRLDYVPPDQVPGYLASASVGVIPFRKLRNSEVGLPTKFREYLHAGLPQVVGDQGLTGRTIRETGIGEPFEPGNVEALAAALRSVLADPEPYRTRITDALLEEHSWEAQESVIAAVYRSLDLPGAVAPWTPPTQPRVLIGTSNSAGQCDAWAAALRRSGTAATSMMIHAGPDVFGFKSDLVLSWDDDRRDDRRLELARTVLPDHTHVIMDSGRRMFGLAATLADELELLVRSGVAPALLFHGSDIRDPVMHARRHQFSPFGDPANRVLTENLRKRVRQVKHVVLDFDGPTFVSTPDLLFDVPAATWVPVVVDTDRFAPDQRDVGASRRPVVVHAPSRKVLKGSPVIDSVLRGLHREGVIEYRRIEGVPSERMPGELLAADISVDQVLMDLIGVGAAEAMSAGRVCVALMSDELAGHYPTRPPVVSASPINLERVIRELAGDQDRRRELGRAGRAFAMQVHDGTLSAALFRAGLGIPD